MPSAMTKYEGLPDEEFVFRMAQMKLFHSQYGKDANPGSIHQAQPQYFPAFAVLHSRPAFLLDALRQRYSRLESSLRLFQPTDFSYRYRAPWRDSIDKPTDDAFTYFQSDDDEQQKTTLLRLRAWLTRQGVPLAGNKWAPLPPPPRVYADYADNADLDVFTEDERRSHKALRSPETFLYMAVAQDVLDFVADEDRKAIVNELLSSDVSKMICKGTPMAVDASVGFWHVRANIQARETELERSQRCLSDALLDIAIAQRAEIKVERVWKAPAFNLDCPRPPPPPRMPLNDCDSTFAQDVVSVFPVNSRRPWNEARGPSRFDRDPPSPPPPPQAALKLSDPIIVRPRGRFSRRHPTTRFSSRSRSRSPFYEVTRPMRNRSVSPVRPRRSPSPILRVERIKKRANTGSKASGRRGKCCVHVRSRRCGDRRHHRNLTPDYDSSDSATVDSAAIHNDDDDDNDSEDYAECADE